MPVVIGEVVSEVAEERSAPSGHAAPAAAPALDLDRLEQAQRRRLHRLQRLWAD